MYLLLFCILIVLILFFLAFFFKYVFNNSKENMTSYYYDFYVKNFDRPPDSIISKYFLNLEEGAIQADLSIYLNQVKNGARFVKKKSIVMAGLIRNGEKNVPFIKIFYNQMKKICREIKFLIVENNSSDRTRDILLEWSESDDSVIILCNASLETNLPKCNIKGHDTFYSKNKTPHVKRIEKLSYLRNVYLEYIDKYLRDFDYLCVMDLDLNGQFFIDGIQNSFYHLSIDSSISAISCNGMVRVAKDHHNYYDSFAYVELGDTYEWNTEFDKSSHDQDVLVYVTKKYTKNMNLDKVMSAFGGFCIYQLNHITSSEARYSHSKNNKLSCEHTHFHRNLQNVYVNPRMIFTINYV